MDTDAIVFVRAEEAAVQRIEMPEPAVGEVQVRTLYSTISAGTEGWAFRNLFTWAPTPFPCVPGYQRVGEIAVLGPQVEGWKVGDQVMATIGRWEGEVKPFWGAHAALANTPADQLFRLPEGINQIDASGAVVAQVGYNAASRPNIAPGAWALVYGDGLIGQCAAQAIRARGAKVVLIGHRSGRLALAEKCSADAVVNRKEARGAREQHVAAAVREATGGAPIAVVLDSVQSEEAQREYLPLLERGWSQIVYCGFTPGPTWADMGLLQQHELTAHFVSGWNRARMETTLRLLAEGKMRLSPLITHHVPFTQGPEMYRMIREKSGEGLGITLDWR